MGAYSREYEDILARERKELEEERNALRARVKELEATIEPVRHWYDGDGRFTNVAAMLHNAIDDLQSDRKDVLALQARVKELEAVVHVLETTEPEDVQALRAKLAAAEKERRESEAGADREERMREEMQHERDNAITERDALRATIKALVGALEEIKALHPVMATHVLEVIDIVDEALASVKGGE
jgi:chromosome segregation ATPase